MHGIHQYKPFSDAAFSQAFLNLLGNIDKGRPRWNIEQKLFPEAFHNCHHIKPAGKAQERELRFVAST
jgi:hypothetical protein